MSDNYRVVIKHRFKRKYAKKLQHWKPVSWTSNLGDAAIIETNLRGLLSIQNFFLFKFWIELEIHEVEEGEVIRKNSK